MSLCMYAHTYYLCIFKKSYKKLAFQKKTIERTQFDLIRDLHSVSKKIKRKNFEDFFQMRISTRFFNQIKTSFCSEKSEFSEYAKIFA